MDRTIVNLLNNVNLNLHLHESQTVQSMLATGKPVLTTAGYGRGGRRRSEYTPRGLYKRDVAVADDSDIDTHVLHRHAVVTISTLTINGYQIRAVSDGNVACIIGLQQPARLTSTQD